MSKIAPNTDPDTGLTPTAFLVAALSDTKPNSFEITPDAPARVRLAEFFGILAIKKLRFGGLITPVGRHDWQLDAVLGATVVQSCVITNSPVTTRIDAPVKRLLLKNFDKQGARSDETFDGDDETEALGDKIDLTQAMSEALALNLPQYPRASGAQLGEAVFAAPGVAPMRDKDAKPFAALAELGKKLEK